MKKIIAASAFTALLENIVLPDSLLLFWVVAIIGVDLMTGVGKAIALRKPRTSSGFRDTIGKITQYGGAVLLSIIISNVPKPEGNWAWLLSFAGDGILVYIIYIESLSICENLYAINPRSAFAKYFLKHAISILTFQLKNNPTLKALEDMRGDVVKVLLVLLCLGFAGCAERPIEECRPAKKRKAEKLLLKSIQKCPAVFRDKSAEVFPYHDNTIDSTTTEIQPIVMPAATIQVNCDSLIQATGGGIVDVQCPPCTSYVTTIRTTIKQTVVNRAQIQQLTDSLQLEAKRHAKSIDEVNKDLVKTQLQLEEKTKDARRGTIASIILFVLLLLAVILRLKNIPFIGKLFN